MDRRIFLDCDLDQARRHLEAWGLLHPGPRIAEQAFRGLHQELALDFGDIAGLSGRKVARLRQAFDIHPLTLEAVHDSWDGSRRYAFRLSDGLVVESVLIPRHGRYTVCLSSQAGCALACRFCATGRLGLLRNLRTHEIVDQVLQVTRHAGCRADGIVFMGMGEPLQNEAAVFAACRILSSNAGVQISPRKMLISTAGIVPAIRRFTRAGHRMQLVFSLVAADPEKRAMLMPIQKRFGFDAFLDAIREHAASRGGKHVTLEYVAIRGLTLGDDDIEAIRRHLVGFPFILNVIPLNPVEGSGLEPPDLEEVKAWTERLRPLGFPVKVRRSAGRDRLSGCGQLGATLAAGRAH